MKEKVVEERTKESNIIKITGYLYRYSKAISVVLGDIKFMHINDA